MNRRSLLALLPAGFFGSVKAQYSATDDVWIVQKCQRRIGKSGKFVLSQCPPPQLDFDTCFSRFMNDEDSKNRLRESEALWQRQKDAYKELPLCGATFKRLLGTNVICPKCGGFSGGSDEGILL